jgi:hypothetical protein
VPFTRQTLVQRGELNVGTSYRGGLLDRHPGQSQRLPAVTFQAVDRAEAKQDLGPDLGALRCQLKCLLGEGAHP